MKSELESLTGKTFSTCHVVSEGFSPAQRFRILCSDGNGFFLKLSVNDFTARSIITETIFYKSVGNGLLVGYIGTYEIGGVWVLVLEDIGINVWSKPLSPKRINEVTQACLKIKDICSFKDLPIVELQKNRQYEIDMSIHTGYFSGWAKVVQDIKLFAACLDIQDNWLDRHIQELVYLESKVSLEGDTLLHGDLRIDNVGFSLHGVKIVDWDHFLIGNPEFDLATLHVSCMAVGAEGIPNYSRCSHSMLALRAGMWVYRSAQPPMWLGGGEKVRVLQKSLAYTAIEWLCKVRNWEKPGFGGYNDSR